MGTEIILVAASSLFVLFVFFLLFNFIIRYQKRSVYFAREKELLQSRFSQALLQTQLEIKEQTMQHIATELHDNMGQVLSLIKLYLSTIPLDDKEKAAASIGEVKELVKQLITDMRSLSVSLNTDQILRAGLSEALKTEITRISRTGQFNATFEQDGGHLKIDNQKAIILFRMVQEILNNMVKHSEANNISLSFHEEDNHVVVLVSDDGKGFDIEEQMYSGGAGLHNLKKRAALIQASLDIRSAEGRGTQISIRVPGEQMQQIVS